MTLTTSDRLMDMPSHEALEMRFVSEGSGDRYQLLASVTHAGTLSYTLHKNPHGNYSYSFPSSLTGHTTLSLPMKAYRGWQADLVSWLCSLSTMNGKNLYTVEDMR